MMEFRNEYKYSDKQINTLLDHYFRDQPRPAPWPIIARAMGTPGTWNGLDDLLWKIVTGYTGHAADGPRRAAPVRGEHRAGLTWWPREDNALHAALRGEGQRRQPPCDIDYIATVLGRPVEEVAARWEWLNKDELGRAGFFGIDKG